MPTTTETINYDSFLAVTTKEFSREMKGQYLTRRPAVGLFFDEYRHTDSNGGRTWQGMVDYGQAATVQFWSGSDTFSTQPQQVAQPIQFDWKYLGGGISITKTEQLENSGPVALASLLDTRMKQLNRTFDLVIGNEIFSDGTNFGGKSFFGLAAAISTTPTAGTFGGLTCATWPFWQNNAATAFGSFAANGPNGTTDAWITNWNNCTDGDQRPSFTISAQAPYEYYHKTNNVPVRFVRPGGQGGTADITWESLGVHGSSVVLGSAVSGRQGLLHPHRRHSHGGRSTLPVRVDGASHLPRPDGIRSTLRPPVLHEDQPQDVPVCHRRDHGVRAGV